MDKRGLVSLKRFIRIVTEGGTSKEIDALWDKGIINEQTIEAWGNEQSRDECLA
jgi:hypothetical protein